MKKIKLLPLLLAVPMLASCGLAKPKQPKFADVGKEVAYAKFSEDLQKQAQKAAFNSDKALESGVFKLDTRISVESNVKRDKKEIAKSSSLQNTKEESKYDKANKILEETTQSSSTLKSKSQFDTANNSSSLKDSYVYQEGKKDGKKYVVKYDKATKEISKESSLESTTTDKYLDSKVKSEVGVNTTLIFYFVFAEYEGSSDADKKNFKFYENGDIYTITWNVEKETKTEETKTTNKTDMKIQVDFNKEKLASKIWLEASSVVEYLKDSGSDYYKGDIETKVTKESSDISYQFKDVKLKAADLSKGVFIGAKW